jgi:hypothetical protein
MPEACVSGDDPFYPEDYPELLIPGEGTDGGLSLMCTTSDELERKFVIVYTASGCTEFWRNETGMLRQPRRTSGVTDFEIKHLTDAAERMAGKARAEQIDEPAWIAIGDI